MAVLTELPHPEVIRRFKRTLDFYTWKGIPCARSWPRPPSGPRSAAVQVQIQWLQQANAAWTATTAPIRHGFNRAAKRSSWSGRDLFMKHFFGTIEGGASGIHSRISHPTPYPVPDPMKHYWAITSWDAVIFAGRWLFLRAHTTSEVDLEIRAFYEPPFTRYDHVNDRGRIFHKGPLMSEPTRFRPLRSIATNYGGSCTWLADLDDWLARRPVFFHVLGLNKLDGYPYLVKQGGLSPLGLLGPLGLGQNSWHRPELLYEYSPAHSPWFYLNPEESTIDKSIEYVPAVAPRHLLSGSPIAIQDLTSFFHPSGDLPYGAFLW